MVCLYFFCYLKCSQEQNGNIFTCSVRTVQNRTIFWCGTFCSDRKFGSNDPSYPGSGTMLKSAPTAIWDYSSIFPPPTCKYYNQKDQEWLLLLLLVVILRKWWCLISTIAPDKTLLDKIMLPHVISDYLLLKRSIWICRSTYNIWPSF